MHRKKLSNGSDPYIYEDLSESIQSGMADFGYNLTDPLGIALDLRDRKVSGRGRTRRRGLRGNCSWKSAGGVLVGLTLSYFPFRDRTSDEL